MHFREIVRVHFYRKDFVYINPEDNLNNFPQPYLDWRGWSYDTAAQFKYCLGKVVIETLFNQGPSSASTAGLAAFVEHGCFFCVCCKGEISQEKCVSFQALWWYRGLHDFAQKLCIMARLN